jgi:hypothetical protein
MHELLTRRIEIPRPRIPWRSIRKGAVISICATVAGVNLYVLTAPPIIKAIAKDSIRHSQHFHWPGFYAPLLLGLENDSPMMHGPFRWYFNRVWGFGMIFSSDDPTGGD